MPSWNDQVNEMYNNLETSELEEEIRSYRTQINRDFQAADTFAEIGKTEFVEPRREAARALITRVKRIQKILEKRKEN